MSSSPKILIKLASLFFFLTVVHGCRYKKKPLIFDIGNSKFHEKIVVNDTSYTNAHSIDSITSEFQFIKLETKPECLIGAINKIIKLKNYLIILDKRVANNVFIFTAQGQFISKILNQRNNVEGAIADIDVRNDTLFVLHHSKIPSIHFYNMQWKKIGAYYFQDLYPANMCIADFGLITYSNFTQNRKGYLYRIISSDLVSHRKIKHGFLPYKDSLVSFVTLLLDNNIFKGKERILVHEFANDTLYSLNAKTGMPSDSDHVVHFLKNGMSNKFGDPLFIKDATTYITYNKISTLSDIVWENDKYLYFNYLNKSQEMFFLWDKKSKKSIINTLALISAKNGIQIPTLWFKSDNESEILTYYNSHNIFQSPETFSRFREMSKVFTSYKKSDNPVICVIALK